jgi:TolB-like protein
MAVALGGWLTLRRREPAANPRRVVVAAFENQTGDTALAPLGNMAADWITQGLTLTGIVEVADAPTALTVAREAGLGTALTGADAVRRFSRETGAGLVVTGRYYRQADSLGFVAQVVDARTGKIVRAVGPVTAPAAAPMQGAEGLRQRLMAELAVLLDERLARFQALERQPPSYEAYREYMDGLVRYLRGTIEPSAVDHFERAFALDSTFYRTLLWDAQCVMVAPGDTNIERYDSLLARVDRSRARLTPAEQSQLDYVRALRAGDFRAAYAAARLRWEASQGSDDALLEMAISAYRLHRLREASELYARLDPDRGLLRGYVLYWQRLGLVQHLRDDFAGQLRTLAEWARRDPESLSPDFFRLGAFAALGRTDELRSLAARYADRVPNDATQPYVVAAHELAAHGRQSAALAFAQLGLTRCAGAATPTPDQIRADFPLDCADLFEFVGRWREADALIPRVAPAGRVRLYLMYAGVAAARLGDRARALALSDSLARLPVRTVGDMYEIPLVEYRRAVIAAALGDREDALRRLRLYRAAGDYHPEWLHSEPVFVPYFSDPRFRKLLESED